MNKIIKIIKIEEKYEKSHNFDWNAPYMFNIS